MAQFLFYSQQIPSHSKVLFLTAFHYKKKAISPTRLTSVFHCTVSWARNGLTSAAVSRLHTGITNLNPVRGMEFCLYFCALLRMLDLTRILRNPTVNIRIGLWRRRNMRKANSCSATKHSPHSMEPICLLPCSLEPVTSSCIKLHETGRHPHILFLFILMLCYWLRSSV
jgi:hypothetical protein